MRPILLLIPALFVLAFLAVTLRGLPITRVASAAQPPGDPSAQSTELLVTLLERPSVLLIDIDLSTVDLESMIAWGMQRAGMSEEHGPPEQIVQMAASLIDSLNKAGAQHVYLSVATRSIHDGGPVVIVPCQDVAAVEGVAAMLVMMAGADSVLQVRTRPGLVLVGPAKALDRLESAAGAGGVARDDLAEPLTNPQRMDHIAVLSLVDAYRQELVSIWPESLPQGAAVQLSPRQLVKDVRRITLGWNLPPEPAIQARLEAADDQAAARVQESLERLLAQLSAEATRRLALDSELPLAKIRRNANEVTLEYSSAMIEDLIKVAIKVTNRLGEESQKANDMKQIGLAMHYYQSVYKHLPPKHFINAAGQPLVSWRVAILPFIEQQALYESFKLDQAWDAAANATVTSTVVPIYADRLGDDPSKTRFRLPVFPGSAWDGDGPPKDFRDIADGLSRTIAVIHAPAEAAVPWADPAQWIVSSDDPMKDVFGNRDEVSVLFFDGSVRTLRREEMDNEKLAAMLTIAGGESVTW